MKPIQTGTVTSLLSALPIFLLCASSASAIAGLPQNALDTKLLADCLQGWDIAWRLPYYPQIVLDQCKTDPVPTNKSASVAQRRLKLSLHFDIAGFPAADGTVAYYDALRAIYTHFDKLFTEQGFTRIDEPGMNTDRAGAPVPNSANYQRVGEGSQIRIEYSMLAGRDMELMLTSYGNVPDAPALPAPSADLDITVAGKSGALFTLKDAHFAGESVVWQQIPDEDFSPSDSSQNSRKSGPSLIYAPARQLVYQSTLSVDDALLSWRIALEKAGWKVKPKGTWYGMTKTLVYALPNRTLEIGMSAYQDRGPTAVTIILMDHGLWQSIMPSLRAMEWDKPWEIAPEFDASGNPTANTRHQFFAMSQATAKQSYSPLYIIPVVPSDQANNAMINAQAQKAAKWVHDEILRAGIFRDQPTAIDIRPNAKPSLLPKFGVQIGARVTYENCRTLTESKPGSTTKNCSCEVEGEQISTYAGECRP
jgi:hypothetical protein